MACLGAKVGHVCSEGPRASPSPAGASMVQACVHTHVRLLPLPPLCLPAPVCNALVPPRWLPPVSYTEGHSLGSDGCPCSVGGMKLQGGE